ncbi:hypothetical protein [Helicobacter equorum]|uniref:hypothetical protein n=1 Tax=Helicobacter equorum TaxID=361872 RepID=UPI000CF13470|nr:hypothetical protein [Helicobacter equorum]
MQGFALYSYLAFLYCQKEFDNVAQITEYAKTDQATLVENLSKFLGFLQNIDLMRGDLKRQNFT